MLPGEPAARGQRQCGGYAHPPQRVSHRLRHVTALKMTHRTTDPAEVTHAMVRSLWDQALDTPGNSADIHDRTETLLGQANSESPVVTRGLMALHSLTSAPTQSREETREHRDAWLAEVDRYDADPQGWMRRYFQAMVRDFTNRHGQERGSRFALKLVRNGLLDPREIPSEAVGDRS